MEANEVAIIIVACGTLMVTVGGGIAAWFMKLNKAENTRRVEAQKAATDEREMMAKYFSDSIKILSEATERNTKAQERTANEAKERNGHLAELQIRSQEMIDRNASIYEKGIKEILCQKVKKQTVDEQVVHHQTEE